MTEGTPNNTDTRSKDRLGWGIFLGGLIVLAIAGACVIGYLGSNVKGILAPPTATPSPKEVIKIQPPTIQDIQRVGEVATVKHSLTAEISDTRIPDDFRSELGVKEEILLLAYGDVAAGFDLAKMDESDVWVDGTRIQIQLPAPEILYSRLDTERTRVVYYKKSLFMERDIGLEGRTREEAEKAIREAALEGDILQQASEYGELFFSNWLYSLGFTEVRVIVG